MTDSSPASNLKGKHLLIVEDDWLLQDLLSNRLSPLREQGVDISAAFDGDKALALAAEHRPDIVLLDILLPGMTGFEFLEAMQKKDPSFKDVPVIVFSNLNSTEDRDRAKALGVRSFMNKSESDIDDISKEIASVLTH